MSWWPSAGGAAWDWGWTPHPAVWLLLIAFGCAYALRVRSLRPGRRRAGDPEVSADQIVLFAAGLAVLWAALDWPLGALAAGYLASANALQDLLITLGAAPLLLLGLPRGRPRPEQPPGGLRDVVMQRLRRALGSPVVGGATFGITLAATHLPAVVDALRPSPWGSFAITAAWLAAATVLWSPLVGPLAGRHRPPYLVGMLYLVAPFVFPKVVGAFYLFRQDPLYGVYEGAPRVWADVTAHGDQQAAGFTLWIIGSFMVIAALAVLFFRWYQEDRRMSTPDSLEVPADPRAVAALFDVPGGWAALERLIASVRTALPPRWSGAELTFAYRELGGAANETQVILELHVALDGRAEAQLARAIETDYEAHLESLPPPRRERIARRIAFRIVGYGSRVS